ncbi:diaminopimelate decarboxylase [Desulfosoma caldarium]|uniref:Diaminopimelate decarboxylase n=1 Tax=Desulfosoma caldarium TaxID=610254 RepID=A0A3N1UU54_9BACT|nr:diaminopimelate decarboxylase [Desulfosoma caldarium]ROQ92260.1 diaminopimelate decarboxylase [Desulfosoma caldarium]
MHHFQYRQGRLYGEEVPVEAIVKDVGTPVYIYSRATLTHHFQVFDGAFSSIPHLTCYSVKANSNLAILALFGSLGGGVDIVSGGELFRARRAGIAPAKIVYSGVGKTREEIDDALSEDILMFNIESRQELEAISQRAQALGRTARIALRVNPDVDPKTHPYIATGMEKNKFGIRVDEAIESYRYAMRLPHIKVVGIDCHIGSQLTDTQPFVDALKRLRILMERLYALGISVQYLDLGGGLGIPYADEEPPHPVEYAKAILKEMNGLSCTLIFEPGRVLVGNAGILVTRVLYTKTTPTKHFIIVDAGMNDLIRPSLYGAYHHIQPVVPYERDEETVDVVGPICESGDFLARQRTLPRVEPGELLAVMSAGAYGFSMSSNYNSRPRPAEVLVDGSTYHVIRHRETREDLVRLEKIPPM